jgi:hypothetical protein
MVKHRVTQLKKAIIDLLERVASEENFVGILGQAFLMNNYNFITRNLNLLPQQEILLEDLGSFQVSEASAIEEFTQITLKNHFPGLMQVLGGNNSNTDSNSSSDLNSSNRAA